MGILAYLRRTGQGAPDLVRLTGLPRTTIYRLIAEERRNGYIRGIDGTTIARLFEGTRGGIRVEPLLGLKARWRNKAA